MPSTTKRYPLSTPDGNSIPLDVIKPYGFIKVSFTGVVSSTITIPEDIEIISFTCTENCFISFGGTAAVPASGTVVQNLVYCERDIRVTVAPTSRTFTVISDGTNGVLNCQLIDKWAGLTLETQQARR